MSVTNDGPPHAAAPPDQASAAPDPAVMRAAIVGGLARSVILLFVALPFARELGALGIAWSFGVVLVVAYDVWTYLIRDRGRW